MNLFVFALVNFLHEMGIFNQFFAFVFPSQGVEHSSYCIILIQDLGGFRGDLVVYCYDAFACQRLQLFFPFSLRKLMCYSLYNTLLAPEEQKTVKFKVILGVYQQLFSYKLQQVVDISI